MTGGRRGYMVERLQSYIVAAPFTAKYAKYAKGGTDDRQKDFGQKEVHFRLGSIGISNRAWLLDHMRGNQAPELRGQD